MAEDGRLLHPASTRTGNLEAGFDPSVTYRIALGVEADLRSRLVRVLQAWPDITIGVLKNPSDAEEEAPTESVLGWDVLAVDHLAEVYLPRIHEAAENGIPVVVGAHLPARFSAPNSPFVCNASTGGGLAAALARYVSPGDDPYLETRLAWTVAGRPLRAGQAVTFPEPVGPLWAGRHPTDGTKATCYVAPTDSGWGAVRVDLMVGDGNGGRRMVLGISDHHDYLKAAGFGAAIMAAAKGTYSAGLSRGPGDSKGVFMEIAQEAGLRVARFHPEDEPQTWV